MDWNLLTQQWFGVEEIRALFDPEAVVYLALALALFGVQLAANALWSWLFFAWRSGPAAAVEVLVLLVLIAATVAAFWHRSRVAALLLLPYALWVSFASVLTWSLWRSNPGLL